jgi:hypothetical protein
MRFILAVLAFIVPAAAEELHDHAAMAAGEFYSKWNRPDKRSGDGVRNQSCCNQRDCAQAEIVRMNGRWYVRNHKMAPNRDVLIPDSLMEHNQGDPRESPDQHSHVCLDHTGAPLCAVLGSGI